MKNFTTLAPATIGRKQRGFTIVELLVVLAIIAVLSIIGIPAARGIITDGKIVPTSNDLSKIVAKVRSNASNQGINPYVAINTAVFANTARGMISSLSINSANATATIQHDIGTTNSQITVAPATLDTTLGDSFTVTLPTVNEAACPGLSSQLSKTADVISLNGTVVKPYKGNYNGSAAQNLCNAADTNTYVFTFR
jgi:prepilin-type N-terminal cleavage/methylation domain-containing protein